MKSKLIIGMALCGFSLVLSAGEVRQYKAGEVPDAKEIARMLGGGQSKPALRTRGISLNASAVVTQTQQPAIQQPVQMATAMPVDNQPKQPPQITTSAFALPIQFKINSATILPSALPQLNAVAEGLKLISNPLIMIEGHTDLSGKASYNKLLSEKRAMAVRNYFVNNYGLSPTSFIVVGRGSDALINTQNPYAAENRRVEFRAAR